MSAEFSLEEFFDHLYLGLTAVDVTGEIIAVGGVKLILEEVLVQNQDLDIRDRREAGLKLHQALLNFAKLEGYPGVHAFIQDKNWMRHLLRMGFRETVGKSIICDTF